MGWWLLSARLGDADDAELVASRLWSLGARGVAESGPGTGTPTASDVSGSATGQADAGSAGGTILTAGFPDRDAADRAAAALDVVEVRTTPVDEHGWVEAWRRTSQPAIVGGLVVRAPWHPPRPGAGLDVVIDPGSTFGHGGHPTTRLVLAQLERLVRPGASVLDVGCGSGVLAVAAAALGAGAVVAVDTDPDAVAATRANAAANGVEVDVRSGTATADLGRFDLVVANLLAPALRQLGPDLVAVTGPSGRLVVAGLLDVQRAGVEAALRPLATRRSASDGDWVLLELAT